MNSFVVEADGGSRGNPGPAGYGAVVIEAATGETLAEAAEYIGVATNNVAEYKGLIAGLRAAHAIDPEARIHVRMDSKLVVEQMSGRWKIKHPDMKPLAAEAARVFPASSVTYEWIPREKNKHADRLANEAMDAGRQGRQWEPSGSTAGPGARGASGGGRDAGAARVVGDAAAGAARARAALTGTSSGTGRGAGASGTAPDRSAAPSEEPPAPLAGSAGTGRGNGGATAGPRLATATAPGEPATAPGEPATAPGEPAAATARTQPGPPPVGWAAPADLGAPATFVLLRHGETALTPEKRFSGSGGSDPELSPAGERQAEAVAAALAARGTVQEIVSSPLKRCRQTAEAVAARLNLDIRIEDGLRETDFGAWEGLTFAEVQERYPDDLNAWLTSAKAAPTGGGESFTAVTRRVSAARDKLVARYAGRTVLLVTHVTPIKTLVRLALGAPPESVFRMELSAASVSAVAYYTDGNASVRLLNDTSHLRA
ncbi:bifunctional RNase H/acid phosphatase [Streptomyces sp. NPDC051018]|uniref:bifunctional RNase H/acid phosphatase n=1 Tax=Streptomyces sp. NPDC051018 TaxID=3365639 RepID=UPI0037899620